MTHPNFKSLQAEVKNVNDIEKLVGHAFCYQYMFERRAPPWESRLWDWEELQQIKVETDKINRLYSIAYYNDGVSGSNFYLLVRMEYEHTEGRHVFMELTASCDYTGFDCQGGGEIYTTVNPNLFCKVITGPPIQEMEDIRRSLTEDGYHLMAWHVHRPISAWYNNNPPMLKHLWHLAIKNNIEKL